MAPAVHLVERDALPGVWPLVSPMLGRRKSPFADPLRLYRELLLDQRSLWMVITPRSCLALIVTTHARNDVLIVHLAMARCRFSKIPLWIDEVVRVIEYHALQTACVSLRVYARKGWISYAKRFGRNPLLPAIFRRDRPTLRGRPRKNRVHPEIGVNASCPSIPRTRTTTATLRVSAGCAAR